MVNKLLRSEIFRISGRKRIFASLPKWELVLSVLFFPSDWFAFVKGKQGAILVSIDISNMFA